MTSKEYMAMLEELAVEEECAESEAPAIFAEPAITEHEELPELPPELIEGVIRKGGKLLIAGASKAGKSYLLIELAVAVATGGWWLDRLLREHCAFHPVVSSLLGLAVAGCFFLAVFLPLSARFCPGVLDPLLKKLAGRFRRGRC